jgi:hypothetical protein
LILTFKFNENGNWNIAVDVKNSTGKARDCERFLSVFSQVCYYVLGMKFQGARCFLESRHRYEH